MVLKCNVSLNALEFVEAESCFGRSGWGIEFLFIVLD